MVGEKAKMAAALLAQVAEIIMGGGDECAHLPAIFQGTLRGAEWVQRQQALARLWREAGGKPSVKEVEEGNPSSEQEAKDLLEPTA